MKGGQRLIYAAFDQNISRTIGYALYALDMQSLIQQFLTWLQSQLNFWVALGLFGQFLFMMRFVFQWLHSERAKQSVIPEIFWYFSLGGGLILLTYAVHRQDLVFILGQALGVFIYIRNIQFIWREKRRRADGKAQARGHGSGIKANELP